MSALDELRDSGRLGEHGARLLYDMVAAIGRFRRFPAPSGRRPWTADDVAEVAHAFLTHRRTPARLASIALEASDDSSLARLFNTAVLNYLRDEARASDRGHLITRMRDVLSRDPARFVRLEATQLGDVHWSLRHHQEEAPWTGDLSDLVFAAWQLTDLVPIRWVSADRRSPVADERSWQTLAEAVLNAAAAPVPERSLADVAEARFNHITRPTVVELTDLDYPLDEPDPTASADTVDADTDAIWPQLTERDRVIIAHHQANVRQLATVLGLGKSAAAEARNQCMARLRLFTAHLEDPDAVALTLADRAMYWLDRTTSMDSSSEQ